MQDTVTEDFVASAVHEVRQSLNVLRLTAGSISLRLLPRLDAENATYLRQKLQVIEAQVQLLAEASYRVFDRAEAIDTVGA